MMMDRNVPDELNADRLMTHVRHLSAVIGPRHPASRAEREAATYVEGAIRQIAHQWDVQGQPFQTPNGFRYRIAPMAFLTALSLLTGLRQDRKSQFLSGLLSVGMSISSRDAFLQRPVIWESWLPRGDSQNVIVRIPPHQNKSSRVPLRRVVLLAHLDSGVHRLTTDSRVVQDLPRTLGGLTLMALVGGVLTTLSGRKRRWSGLRTFLGLSALGGGILSVIDEMGPDSAGANGNASGVAALLGLADALHHRPTECTEVILVFTGSATSVAAGADSLVVTYGKEWEDALWVLVNNVGQGELCWVTRHGISPYAYYHPHPEAVTVMERVADARPDLGLMGKPLLTLDELAILRDRDLRAVALMGYDRATGTIPNWRQNSDTIHAIDPTTLGRAAQALWTAVQVVDHADSWPVC